jgi:hypothetical protein
MGKRPTRLYFDPDVWEWLCTVAEQSRCSVSEVVRRLVFAEMARQQAQHRRPTKEKNHE